MHIYVSINKVGGWTYSCLCHSNINVIAVFDVSINVSNIRTFETQVSQQFYCQLVKNILALPQQQQQH